MTQDKDKPAELEDTDLDAAEGGAQAMLTKWKGFSLNGKGNTSDIHGGFSEVSGLNAEVDAVEHREGDDKIRR